MSQFSEALAKIGGFSCKSRQDFSYDPSDTGWSRDASHWKVTLKHGRKTLTTGYHMGAAHRGEPVCADVLHSLILDASSFYNARDFRDWASDFGYDTDSRKAEKIWKVIKALAPKVKKFVAPYSLEELSSLEH